MYFFLRLYYYQRERFPLLLLCGMMGVGMLSSQAVTTGTFALSSFLTALTAMILYLFHIRVIDELRDYYHDTIHHSQRPLPRGTISLQELQTWDRIALLLFFTLLGITNIWVFLGGVILWGYTFVARREFFFGQRLKQHFLLYNSLNLVQLVLLQNIIYMMFHISWYQNLTVWFHLWFLGNLSLLLEIFRKFRRKEQESSGEDTYSAQLGFRRTLLTIGLFGVLSIFICFLILFLSQSTSPAVFGGIVGIMVLFLLGLLLHYSYQTAHTEKLLGLTILFLYVTLNLIIFFILT